MGEAFKFISQETNAATKLRKLTETAKKREENISVTDVKEVFATRLYMALDKRKNAAEHFAEKKKKFSLPSQHKFKVLCACIQCDVTALRELLCVQFRHCWMTSNVFCIDELVLIHNVYDDPLVVFMPRKPHNYGILTYLNGVHSTALHLPYVIDLILVDSIPKTSPSMAFIALSQRLPDQSFKGTAFPHIVVDAAFSDQKALDFCASKNIYVTWSQNSAHIPELSRVLQQDIKKRFWRMFSWKIDEQTQLMFCFMTIL